MAFGIHHVHLKTRDPKQTMQFYVDNLGATLLPCRRCPFDPRVVALFPQSVGLHLDLFHHRIHLGKALPHRRRADQPHRR